MKVKQYFLLCSMVCLLLTSSIGFSFDKINWHTNYDEGLYLANKTQKPVFIYFYAPWCSWCYVYEQGTLSNSQVVDTINDYYIPILINFDARPDLVEKFQGFGLPFTIILAPNAQLLARLPGILTERDMNLTLQQVLNAPVKNLPTADILYKVEDLSKQSYQQFFTSWQMHLEDIYHPLKGTFSGILSNGVTLKRPAPQAWSFKLDNNLWQQRTEIATLTILNNLFDQQHGGFFYFKDTHRADQHLETAKLLDANVWLISLFAKAGKQYDNQQFINAALLSIDYLNNVLWDNSSAGFFQAQNANYNFYKNNTSKIPPPAIDTIKLTDSNAKAAIVFIEVSKLIQEPSLLKTASQTLHYLINNHLQNNRLYQSKNNNMLGEVYNLPNDIFWLLAAMQTAQKLGLIFSNLAQDQQIYKLANQWLVSAMQGKADIALPNKLLGIIAWVAVNSNNALIPTETASWALKQIRIEANTRPDDLVYAFKAWQALTLLSYP